MGLSYRIERRVSFAGSVDDDPVELGERTSPCRQFCARTAYRVRTNVTLEPRSAPAGTGVGRVISTMRPYGYRRL